MKLYQQGDVLIESCEVPRDAIVQSGPIVLAYGETTGHKHAIEDIAGVKFLEKDGLYFLVNTTPMTVVHEEHRAITIPPGTWRVRKVREYDHFLEEAREVRD